MRGTGCALSNEHLQMHRESLPLTVRIMTGIVLSRGLNVRDDPGHLCIDHLSVHETRCTLTERKSKYVIDIEDGGETARLLTQESYLTRSMGGLFPSHYTPRPGSRILDAACGPGGWALDVAFAFPDIEVVGVDINEVMVEYARARARVHQVPNVRFEVMDITQPLSFSPETFDLVNARFLIGVLSPTNWPLFLQECYRVLQPDGRIRLTEADNPVSNSAAMQEMSKLIATALYQADRSFGADGYHIGLITMLPFLLHDAGFSLAEQEGGIHDGSAHAEMFELARQDSTLFYKMIQPFLITMSVASQAELDRLYDTLLHDLDDPWFSALTFWLSVWGKKPDVDH